MMTITKNLLPMSLNLSKQSFRVPPDIKLSVYPQAGYEAMHQAMLDTTLQKIHAKQNGRFLSDEIWLVEHSDVYTLGQAGKTSHILRRTDTPIIKTDRGGQITWHGTGQLVVYFMFDLPALGFGVRDLVSHSEQAICDTLIRYLPPSIIPLPQRQAPGVYLYQEGLLLGKIASLGFKIKHGHSYHGVAINLINDLSPFLAINPCGYANMTMLRLADFCEFDPHQFSQDFLDNIYQRRQGLIKLK